MCNVYQTRKKKPWLDSTDEEGDLLAFICVYPTTQCFVQLYNAFIVKPWGRELRIKQSNCNKENLFH